ncbi:MULTISPECIES: LacI family DNA-binding transcriptional regulator [Microbacterium]|uniref:LacI family DNA-binding transcriptional regulator n=1 Tax=Microbacterium TaxID=33882 RepID=UPI0026030DCC|nr:LacI family DNA-binding transcriptional regulator [Microbacterium sp.]MCV0336410.1 LacI family transcriptional regulator [Microbacterium sp.]MCV0376652.1 LacI family transcriptional regulator [Microbacterium sp.]MCV0391401.1 LacI family transcriptional regulator [Microbacterium sp.]MCV0420007.1 LacI family transcriptional regulator [Microbacterium sp.]MCV0423822.1 LacI family transcriptional regulator [Microbacterium sp.]
MAKAPTVEDVAERAGVSRQTVSNVLNTPDIVRPATRERVIAAIHELGYRRHAAARQLRLRRSSTIGIRLDPYLGGISGVVLDRFVHAITERASERGMRMLVYAARTREEEIQRLSELWEGSEIDAAIITGTSRDDPRVRSLDQDGLPFISFGRPWGEDDIADPRHLWVDVDGAAGTRAATEHALTHGSSVAFLGWPTGSGTGDDRERGWREAMAAAGVQGARLTAEEGVPFARAGVDAALAAGPAPDALVCASDSLAVGALLAVAAAGLSLPVIGFDNTPTAEALGFSSVEQRPEDVATAVLELLMGPTGEIVAPRTLQAGSAHALIAPELVVR